MLSFRGLDLSGCDSRWYIATRLIHGLLHHVFFCVVQHSGNTRRGAIEKARTVSADGYRPYYVYLLILLNAVSPSIPACAVGFSSKSLRMLYTSAGEEK